VTIKGKSLVDGNKEHSLYAVQAEAVPAGKSRTTATRVAIGTVIAPGLGTAVGAIAKKGEHVLIITDPDWSETVVYEDLGKAALAARKIIAAAEHISGRAFDEAASVGRAREHVNDQCANLTSGVCPHPWNSGDFGSTSAPAASRRWRIRIVDP
jgi:hypothetical protein